jgi:hypothetical protein
MQLGEQMTDVEQESIILNLAWEMIDDLVNWSMLVKRDTSGPTDMMFQTREHGLRFVILLGDFLAQLKAFRGPLPFGLPGPPSNAAPSDLTFLFYLRQVARNPQFGSDPHALLRAIEAFATWLEGDFMTEGVNLSEIDVVTDLRVTRIRYLRICGDVAKHNLARLETNVKHVQKILAENGEAVTLGRAYRAMKDFFNWFYGNIFICHASVIAEFLNEIRWAIYEYLEEEYARSWHAKGTFGHLVHYGFRYPAGCDDEVAQAMYWELMNRVRGKPWIPRFAVSNSTRKLF